MNANKLFEEGKRLEKLATYQTLDGRKISDPVLYKQSQDMITLAEEEFSRENIREMKKKGWPRVCPHCGKKRQEMRMCCN